MKKIIDLSKTVYELTREYPEVITIMSDLGFSEIKKSMVRHTMGKVMTIPKGCRIKGISLDTVIRALADNGFEVVGTNQENSTERKVMLQSYLKRLNDGESLESVRHDFAQNFSHVDPSEIMEAEKSLLTAGEPLEKVQQLCDIHSALFHNHTDTEQEETDLSHFIETKGHPISLFIKENDALSHLLEDCTNHLNSNENVIEDLKKIREVTIHYGKKGNLIYPCLKVSHGIDGPSQVMWTVDNEIRDELKRLVGDIEKKESLSEPLKERITAVLQRAKEMIYKENHILLPLCASIFSDDEWKSIYRDSKDYDVCFDVPHEIWTDGEETPPIEAQDGLITMPGGQLTLPQLTALLNTLPSEITFIDDNDINRYFNEGPKLFKRPLSALGRDVYSCHPPKIEPMVRQILRSFKDNKKNQFQIWTTRNDRTVLVTYYAVRDSNGHYIGALETVDDMEYAKEHFEKVFRHEADEEKPY